MRILVTGLNGFTGQYLKSELETHGHDVIGSVSNLRDPDALASELAHIQPEAVIHLAGIAFVAHSNTKEFYEVNLIGTQNLLDMIHKHVSCIKSILLVSSANVYGNQGNKILNEKVAPAPVDDYGVSKLAMEFMANLRIDRLPLFIVRTFNYTGNGQNENFLIPKIVSHFRDKRQVIELGNLDVQRDIGDVRTVVSHYRKLIEISPVGKTINICTGQSYPLKDVISLCESITGHHLDININPEFVRSNEVHKMIGDNSYLKSLLGNWQEYKLEETLQWMLDIQDRTEKTI